MTVAAVVVTYNRKVMLVECLRAILAQTIVPDKIYVIDNASTDGTPDFLENSGLLAVKRVEYLRLKSNEGGAGGFYWGARIAHLAGHEWTWLMDDDVEPTETALERLLAHEDKPNVGFLCSCVRGIDGVTSMNIPDLRSGRRYGEDQSWEKYLSEGLVAVESATFVSILFNQNVFERCGYPNRKFFIWGDDTEFTLRVTQAGFESFLVGGSFAIHKRTSQMQLSVVTEQNRDRIPLYYYRYRNALLIYLRYGNWPLAMRFCRGALVFAILTIVRSKHHKLLRLRVIAGGVYAGLMGNNLANASDWKLSDAFEVPRNQAIELREDAVEGP